MDNEKIERKRIVILGAGYVGVWAYRSLMRRLRFSPVKNQFHVTVVSALDHHVFHGWTGEVLGGIIANEHRLSSLATIFRRACVLRGQILRVDLKNKVVVVQDSLSNRQIFIPYDHLIFGTGSADNKERVVGISRFGWTLKSPSDFKALRCHLLNILAEANSTKDSELQARLMTFVVVGAGFTGVEMCAAISELLQRMRRKYPRLSQHKPRIVLIHSGARILPQLGSNFTKIVSYAEQQLLGLGVEIKCGTILKEVTETGAVLMDGTLIPSVSVLCTLGQVITPIAGAENLPCSRGGRITTDSKLNVKGYTTLWAGGDVAEVSNGRTGKACPANALWAIKHGACIGKNIANILLQRRTKAFCSRGLGQAASLGIFKGAGELWGFQLTGLLAWILRIIFFLWFMPSRIAAIRVVLDWMVLPLRDRRLAPERRTEAQIPPMREIRHCLDNVMTTAALENSI